MQKIQSARARTLSFRRGMCAANDSGGNHRAGIASGKLNYDLISLGVTYASAKRD